MANLILDQRLDLAATLELIDRDARVAAVEHAVVTFSGSLIRANASGNWGPHFTEISLLGICHHGNDLDEAIANWIKAALRVARFEDAA